MASIETAVTEQQARLPKPSESIKKPLRSDTLLVVVLFVSARPTLDVVIFMVMVLEGIFVGPAL